MERVVFKTLLAVRLRHCHMCLEDKSVYWPVTHGYLI